MALPVGASAPELPLGDLTAVFPSAALAGDGLSDAFGTGDEAFSLPVLEPLIEPPPLPEAFAELELPVMPRVVASATPERWLAMAQAQGVLQVSAQPVRPLPVAVVPGDLQRPAEVAAPEPLAPATVAPVPVLANLATAPAPRTTQPVASPSAAGANTPVEAMGRQGAAVPTTVAGVVAVAVAVAVPSGQGSQGGQGGQGCTGEPAPGTGALLPAAVSGPGLAGASAAAQASPPVAAAPLPPPTLEARWGAHMVLALRESVQVQIQQRVQHASIRLDPPHLGSLHVSVSHEAGRVDVHISATQGDTVRLLGQAGERLRQELAEQHPGQVSVSVSAEGQGRQPSRQPLWRADPERPAAAREDSHPDTAAHTAQGSDVWVTV
jgi:flagellar hook-length control protein FliK